MRGKAILAVWLIGGFLIGASPSARADVMSAACVLGLTVRFDSPVGFARAGSGYSISASGDLCVVAPDIGDPTRSTTVSGSGSGPLWTCGAAFAIGSWQQSWSGGSGPRSFTGTHIITGTWGAWTLTVAGLSPVAVGVAHLAIHPSDAAKVTSCLSGVTSVRMLGTLVLQDP